MKAQALTLLGGLVLMAPFVAADESYQCVSVVCIWEIDNPECSSGSQTAVFVGGSHDPKAELYGYRYCDGGGFAHNGMVLSASLGMAWLFVEWEEVGGGEEPARCTMGVFTSTPADPSADPSGYYPCYAGGPPAAPWGRLLP